SPESLTEEFITDYGKYDHMKWFRNLRKLRDAGTDNTREDYRNDRLTTVTQAEKYRICLELLKTCTPVKDVDDRILQNRYGFSKDQVDALFSIQKNVQPESRFEELLLYRTEETTLKGYKTTHKVPCSTVNIVISNRVPQETIEDMAQRILRDKLN